MVWRIRDRATFEALRRTAQRARRDSVAVAFAVVGEERAPRVAYAVGRRTGGAVVRNRVRRRLRAAVREVAPDLSSGAYLVSAGREASELPFEELKAQVRAAMRAAAEERRR